MLYKKLSYEFKDRLVTIRKVENLNDLSLLLRDIDANIKKFSKQFQLRTKPNAYNFPTTQSPFMLYKLAPIKPSIAVGVAVVFPIFSTATGTHPGSMNVSNMIRQGLISQEEKDRCNSLGLCRYYGKSGYLTINHRNPILLAIKKQAAGALMGNLMALVPYKPLPVEEKKTFMG